MATPESIVKKQLKKCLDALAPHVWYYMPVSTGYGKHGVPDFLICILGRFLAIETKAGKGRVTALQAMQLTKISEAGATVWVVDETNVDHTIRCLQAVITIKTLTP